VRTAFHDQLHALTRSIGDMCGLAGTAMQQATHALLEADIVLAEIVISDQDNLVIQAAQAEATPLPCSPCRLRSPPTCAQL
jgi:phosphate transport system protein